MRSRLVIILLVAVGMILFSNASAAAKQPAVEQFMPTLSFNSNPKVKNFTLMWVEDRGKGKNIYAKRLFRNGLPQGGPAKTGWQVIRDTSAYNRRVPPPGPRSDPSLIYHGTRKEFMLVYSELTGEADGWDVFSVRVSSAGYATGNPRLLAGGPGDQQHPDVSFINDGRRATDEYIVVWDDNSRDVDEVWALRLRANGIPKGKPYLLVQNPSNATDPTTNGSVVAWVDDRERQTDIWALRLKNGLPNGVEYAVSSGVEDEFNPRFSGTGLLWNIFDPSTGIDIMGVQILENQRVSGTKSPILVPAADQNWPDGDNGIVVFSDNRSGDYDLYGVRITSGRLMRARGHDYPVLSDYQP